MDFRKKLAVYASILGVLVVLFVVGTVAQAVSMEPPGAPLFPAFKSDAVTKITVTDKDGNVEIDKTGDAWTVTVDGENFPASTTNVETLLDNFTKVRKSMNVTADKDKWLQFNVDDPNAVHIVLASATGETLAECWFGKGGTTSFTQYVRLPGAPDVIQTDVRIEKTSALKEWAEMRLFPDTFYVADVKSVSIKTSLVFDQHAKSYAQRVSYTLIPGEKNKEGYTTWTISENERVPLSPQKVSNLVNAVAGLRGESLVVHPEKLTLDPAKPLGTIEVKLSSGKTDTLSLLGKTEGDPDSFYITNQDVKYIYTAGNWSLSTIFGDASELVDAEALLAPR
ncbi:MAG: DUF4340 domain-containing protein [Spirochaetales bacterium]|nr:DUF4340 domain-containing protein [Spirochaetales bacterium]